MTQALRFDRATLDPSWEKTPEGFLRVKATFARTGLQSYRNADGTTRIELRPEDEVTREDAILSLGGMPVTLEHPPELLTPETAKQYTVGSTGSKISYSNGFVEGVITLTDAKAIEAVERGDSREVSVGYRVDYDPTPGVHNGQRYDGVQRRISANHVAVVRRARAGSTVRVHFDSEDVATSVDLLPTHPQEDHMAAAAELGAALIEGITEAIRADSPKRRRPLPPPEEVFESEEETPDTDKSTEPMAKKETCDSQDDTAATVPASLFKQLEQERDDALLQLETERGINQALESRLDELEATVEQRLDAAAPDLNALVNARITLLDRAALLTGSSDRSRFDSSTDREVMLAAMESLGADIDRFDGRSDDAVLAAFETYVEGAEKAKNPRGTRVDSVDALEALLAKTVRPPEDREDADTARDAMFQRQQEASLAPLGRRPGTPD